MLEESKYNEEEQKTQSFLDVPSHLKDYAQVHVGIVVPLAKRASNKGEIFEGPNKSVKIDLSLEGENENLAFVTA